jgi:hypothetical protein
MTPAIAVAACMHHKVRDQIERAMMAHERNVRRCGVLEFDSVAHTVEHAVRACEQFAIVEVVVKPCKQNQPHAHVCVCTAQRHRSVLVAGWFRVACYLCTLSLTEATSTFMRGACPRLCATRMHTRNASRSRRITALPILQQHVLNCACMHSHPSCAAFSSSVILERRSATRAGIGCVGSRYTSTSLAAATTAAATTAAHMRILDRDWVKSWKI